MTDKESRSDLFSRQIGTSASVYFDLVLDPIIVEAMNKEPSTWPIKYDCEFVETLEDKTIGEATIEELLFAIREKIKNDRKI